MRRMSRTSSSFAPQRDPLQRDEGGAARLCEDINKRYFTIFDYSGASQLEDAEFDGPSGQQAIRLRQKPASRRKLVSRCPKVLAEGVSVVISTTNRYVCLADGRKLPFEEYTEQSREFILDISHKGLDELLRIWIDKSSRHELREALRDRDIYPSAFRHYLDCPIPTTSISWPRSASSFRAYRHAVIARTGSGMKTRSGCSTRSVKRISTKSSDSRPISGAPHSTTTGCSASTISNRRGPMAPRSSPSNSAASIR